MIRKFIAGIVLSLFVTLFAPFVFALGIYDVFSDREFYTTEFVDFTYDYAIDEVSLFLGKTFATDESGDFAKAVNRDFLKKLITKDDYTKLVDDGINVLEDSGFENGYYSVSIPIASSFEEKINTLSPDSREFLILSSLPKQFDFTTTVSTSVSGDLFDYLNGILYKMFFLIIAVLLLLLLSIGLIIFQPWTNVLRWEARAVLIGSITAFLASVVLLILPSKISFDSIPWLASVVPIYSFFIEKIFLTLLYYLVPLLLVSFMLFIFAVYFAKKEAHDL